MHLYYRMRSKEIVASAAVTISCSRESNKVCSCSSEIGIHTDTEQTWHTPASNGTERASELWTNS